MKNTTHSRGVLLTIDRDLRMTDGVSEFIEHLAGKHGVRRQPQHKVFGIEIGAGYDRARELVMLVVESSDESALRAPERVFAGWDMELEASIVAGDDGLHALPILRTGDGDAGARERATALGIYDRAGDAVRAGSNLRSLIVLRLRLRGIEERHTRRGEYGQAPASLDWAPE